MEQYLKDLSQGTYNIIQIVVEHCRDPHIDKKLMSLYKIEKEKLANLLSTQPSPNTFVFDMEILFDSLISNNHDTERSKSRIETAKNDLTELLTKIQIIRGSTHVVTGIEEGELKDYLSQRKEERERLIRERAVQMRRPLTHRTIVKTPIETNLWVTQNNGQYFYEGAPVDIKNKDAQYVKIFDTIFSLKPAGGQIPYKAIIDGCSRKKLHIDNKAIQRAMTGENANFFRYVKDIKLAPARGIALFRASQNGKYLEFNNKKT